MTVASCFREMVDGNFSWLQGKGSQSVSHYHPRQHPVHTDAYVMDMTCYSYDMHTDASAK
jgi:hypothetical protein